MIGTATAAVPPAGAAAARGARSDLFGFLKAAAHEPDHDLDARSISRSHIVAGEGVLGAHHRASTIRPLSATSWSTTPRTIRKDDLQRRVLAPGLGHGLLTAEGEEWRLQRRTLAPLFSPRARRGLLARHGRGGASGCAALAAAAAAGGVIDVALEMTALTLDVLERTIFTPRD